MLQHPAIYIAAALAVGLLLGAMAQWAAERVNESGEPPREEVVAKGWLVQFQATSGSWLPCMVSGGLYQVALALFDDPGEAERYRVERQKAGRAHGKQGRYRIVRARLEREF